MESYNTTNEEFKNKIIEYFTEQIEEENNESIEIIRIKDDSGDFPKEEHIESRIDPTPQILDEHYEKFDQTPDEIVQTELMIREDRKTELRMLAFNQGLRRETYYLINKHFERKLLQHPPKNIEEKIFYDKPEDYPNVLMINEPVNWEECTNNLVICLYI
jgi:hypothetical protein